MYKERWSTDMILKEQKNKIRTMEVISADFSEQVFSVKMVRQHKTVHMIQNYIITLTK